MLDAAYAIFFLAVLLTSAVLAGRSLKREWGRIRAALRGEIAEEVPLPEICGQVSISQRSQPILQPVVISICRI